MTEHGHGHGHGHGFGYGQIGGEYDDPMRMFDQDTWEERYSAQSGMWSGNPNPQLVGEAAGLTPGHALDAGCGEGADARWLAGQGWRVTAMDFAAAALRRAAEQTPDPELAARIDWVRADLTAAAPEGGPFDLVSAQFMHLLPEPRRTLFARLAAVVAPGGTLLIVGHDVGDLDTTMERPPIPEMFYNAREIADSLDPAEWEIQVAESRPRAATGPDGVEMNIHDAVLRARRKR